MTTHLTTDKDIHDLLKHRDKEKLSETYKRDFDR